MEYAGTTYKLVDVKVRLYVLLIENGNGQSKLQP